MCAIRQAKCNAPSLSSEISKYGVKSSTATLIVESQPGVGHVTYIGLVPGGRTIKDLVTILKITKRTSKNEAGPVKTRSGEILLVSKVTGCKASPVLATRSSSLATSAGTK